MVRAWIEIPFYFPSLLTFIFLAIIKFPSFLKDISIILIFSFSIYLFAFHFNQLNYSNIVHLILPLFFISLIISFLKNRNDNSEKKFIIILSLSIIVIRSITGLYVESLYPTSARSMTGDLLNDLEPLLMRLGIASYGFCTGLIFLYPLFIFYLKIEGPIKYKIFIVIVISLTLYLNIQTAFTTAFIFSILAIIASILLSSDLKKNIIVVLFLIITLFVLNSESTTIYLIEKSKIWFSNNEVISIKINEIEESLKYDEAEGDISTRASLYKLSWNTFLQNPLFGSGNELEVGGHASWLDLLGLYGIFGTGLFLWLLFNLFKHSCDLLPKNIRYYYYISFILYMCIGIIKACLGIEIFLMLFVISPSLHYFFQKKLI